MPKVILIQPEMVYNGVNRYRGEIFEFIGARNDDKLVRHNYVRIIDGEAEKSLNPVRDDYSGREFTDEGALNAYRMKAPASDRVVVVRRSPGRPKGATDKQPRARTGVKTKTAPNATVPTN